MKRTKLAVCLSLALTLLLCLAAFGQRIKKHGGTIDITPAGAISVTPATGQTITLGGGTAVSGSLSATGQLSTTKDPANTTNTSASLLVNPVTSAANEKLIVAADNGTTVFSADKEGDAVVAGTLTVGGGTAIAKVLSASASLDFGATAAGACDTLTITVTGAADGDPVFIGVPAALSAADNYQLFRGYVSAADTVTVKRCNLTNATTALSNPAAATVRAAVFHF